MRPRRFQVVRHVVQCAVLLLFLGVGFWGFLSTDVMGEGIFFGSLSSSTVAGALVLTDPFAALGVIAASKTVPFVLLGGAAAVAAFYALIRGRAFCGWVCPLGLFTESANWIGEKTGLRRRPALTRAMPRSGKVVAAVLVLAGSALVSVPIFELVSPVTALPRLFVLGVGVGLWLFVAIVLVELFFPGRLWCTHLCPVGGFYELIGYVGLVGVKNNEACVKCDKCKDVCLADKRILDEAVAGTKPLVSAGDCMVCGKCIDVCPAGSLTWHFGPAFIKPAKKGLPQEYQESSTQDGLPQKPQGGSSQTSLEAPTSGEDQNATLGCGQLDSNQKGA